IPTTPIVSTAPISARATRTSHRSAILRVSPRYSFLIIFAKKNVKNICSLHFFCVHLQRFSEELSYCVNQKKHKLVNYRILNKKFKTL
ncbi:MAG: hypothetical protein ACFNUV_10650, partial [Capnocytophaga endodontalis]